MSATPAAFAKRVLDLIEDRCGRRTAYAYLHPPKGAAAVPEGTLKQWVSRRARPFTDSLVTFAHEMGVTLEYLVLGREPKTPGTTRPESDLAADLRDYLVSKLGTRGEVEKRAKRTFFERVLPKGDALLQEVATVVYQVIETNWRERAERSHRQLLQHLYTNLDRARKLEQRARTRSRRARLQAKQAHLRLQIVAAGRPWDGPLVVDEGAIPSVPTTRAVGGPWEDEPNPAPILNAAWLAAQEQALAAGEPARNAEVEARKARK